MMPPLRYLMQELKFTALDWGKLSNNDREDLKRWAEEEQKALGLWSAGTANDSLSIK